MICILFSSFSARRSPHTHSLSILFHLNKKSYEATMYKHVFVWHYCFFLEQTSRRRKKETSRGKGNKTTHFCFSCKQTHWVSTNFSPSSSSSTFLSKHAQVFCSVFHRLLRFFFFTSPPISCACVLCSIIYCHFECHFAFRVNVTLQRIPYTTLTRPFDWWTTKKENVCVHVTVTVTER